MLSLYNPFLLFPLRFHCIQNVKWATALIDGLSESVQSYPLEETNSRFGNPAFRGWLDSVRQIVPKAHHDILQGARVADEVASYLLNSLGDYQRIDYGTGHEAHFMAWLYCLCRPETGPFFSPTMRPALVLDIFRAYLRLMRRLQMTFWLEPAGSHGVWGLDDYHFLPFLFGAAQLIGSLSPLDPLTSG